MSDQPKPTGKWTHGMAVVEDGVPVKIPNAAIDMLNAALAAEERRANDSIEENVRLLAAEMERADKNADVLEATALELGDAREQLAAERDKANVRETELICERDYFKKELAAEREKRMEEKEFSNISARAIQLQGEVQTLVELAHFFKFVIQSGESWTQTCQKQYKDALAKVRK